MYSIWPHSPLGHAKAVLLTLCYPMASLLASEIWVESIMCCSVGLAVSTLQNNEVITHQSGVLQFTFKALREHRAL